MGEAQRKYFTGLIMVIDFEKCFDMIEYCAIIGALEYFEIGPKFTKWVMLLFTEFELCTQNNGHISEWMQPTWGLNQGCCISPHLMVIIGQLFADLFEQNDSIEGIQ